MKDQITAHAIDILRQAEEQNTVISQEDAEMYAMRDVLGVRRDWKVRIGPSIPRSSMGVAQALYRGSSSLSFQTNPLVAEMRAQMDAQQAKLQEMRLQIAFLTQMHNQPPTIAQPPPTPQPGGTNCCQWCPQEEL